ncbi:Gfo/Idh/MocA family protein [Fundicoccus culcitae]|uniref:Gfo/Idh/MocA family oxidoreductase n=1 Tax=Fundicoccus culcitae TaxID=2969821 RepID=A0ABY5P5E0_9LACT|nr:Gfo/Idh/MocA family oxidoreductase [Fundicoccus culcitae]UUX33904.1 Gfo/Idh/MocA family oxidoreductase [Fundicoccus culcitae]
MEKLGIAIVGYGGMGTYHASTLIPEEYFDLKGIWDIAKKQRALAEENDLHVFESFEAVLEDKSVEAILIATPNDSHKAIAIQALEAGKHVICEKPVMLSTEELDEVLAVAEKADRIFMVHQNRRWDPDFLVIKELMHNHQIGEIFQIESRVHGANGIPGDWRHVKAQGGGMILDWGVHLLDQIHTLVDSPIKTMRADLSFVLGNEVDDGFTVTLIHENGLKSVVEVGTTNYVKLPRWYVKGTEGTAIIEDWDLSGTMIVATGDSTATPQPIQAGVGLTKTMAPPSEEATEELALPTPHMMNESFYFNFYRTVREGAEPIVKNEEVRYVMQLMERIFEEADVIQ